MKKTNIRSPRHTWTKSEIKTVFKIWDESNPEDIAKELNVSREQIMYIAHNMRKAGIKLTKKHKKGYLHNLIREVMSEVK